MAKILQPLPHGVLDYVWAANMITAPWVLGFSKNKAATMNAVGSGAAIVGLSLLTRYPLGAVKAVPFPVHGVIETIAGVANIAAPWLMGFADNKRARWLHILSGLTTLAVVAMTDYQAAGQPKHQHAGGLSSVEEGHASELPNRDSLDFGEAQTASQLNRAIA